MIFYILSMKSMYCLPYNATYEHGFDISAWLHAAFYIKSVLFSCSSPHTIPPPAGQKKQKTKTCGPVFVTCGPLAESSTIVVVNQQPFIFFFFIIIFTSHILFVRENLLSNKAIFDPDSVA